MDIDLVLTEFAEARSGGGELRLAEWIARYPDHADELLRFAMFSDVATAIEPTLPADPAAEAGFAARAGEVAQRLRAAERTTAAISSLVREARSRGFTPLSLAQRLGLSLSLVAKLEQRLIAPATIPSSLVRRLSEALGRKSDEVAGYLALPPRFAQAGLARSEDRLHAQEQSGFRETIAESIDLSEEQKRFWLSGEDR